MSTGTIPEINFLLQLVEKQYGRKLATTTDFESLSVIIERDTGELLSSSTLKRLYGYVSLKPIPRKSTLDILARYIGARSYEQFRQTLKDNPTFNSNFFSTKTISSSELKTGDRLRIGWVPDRILTLRYLGDEQYEVLESINSKILVGDRFSQVSFLFGYPLYITSIQRGEETTSSFIAGMQGGLNLLEIL